MAYKNAKVTFSHAQHSVRKAWTLFFRWQQTQLDTDLAKYQEQRELAANAVRLIEQQKKTTDAARPYTSMKTKTKSKQKSTITLGNIDASITRKGSLVLDRIYGSQLTATIRIPERYLPQLVKYIQSQ